MGNIIRREVGLPDRVTYTRSGTSKINSSDDTAMEIVFGYLNGSMDLNLDIPKTQFFDPPPKYPPKEGTAILNEKKHQQMIKINYIIQLNYDAQKKVFDFI